MIEEADELLCGIEISMESRIMVVVRMIDLKEETTETYLCYQKPEKMPDTSITHYIH